MMEHYVKGQLRRPRAGGLSDRPLTANTMDARNIERINDVYTAIWLSRPRGWWFALVFSISMPGFSRFAMTPPGLLFRAQLLAGDG